MTSEDVSRPTLEDVQAAQRLWDHANSDCYHARRTAAFLLSLYDGSRFPIRLSSLRLLDRGLYRDCVQVLDMHYFDDFFMHLGIFDDEAYERLAARFGLDSR